MIRTLLATLALVAALTATPARAAAQTQGDSSFLAVLHSSLGLTDDILSAIETRWDIKNYPNFLKSGYMSVRAWKYLRVKLEQKIVSAQISRGIKNFTIAFTGSSVTAGHDSDYVKSFPALVGLAMRPALAPLGVNVVSRNVAFGNNPCLPYDVCVRVE